ncbi:hypothetical protein ACTFIT_002221 [Dictyostelium discoideum]
MKNFKYLFKVISKRQSGETYKTITFYSCFISFTICLSLFLEIFKFSREFFEFPYIIIYVTLFTSTIVSSSDSFNVILKTAFEMMISCIVGDIVAYTIFSIFFNHLWISIFLYMLFILITSGIFLSSKNDKLNWTIGKRMYFEIFSLLYVVRSPTRSPIIFLKAGLASIITLLLVTIGCLILNPFFSSELFLRTSVKILHRSHQCNKSLLRQLELKTINEFKISPKRKSHKKIIKNIHSRLSNSLSNLPNLSQINNNNNNSISLSNYEIEINNNNNKILVLTPKSKKKKEKKLFENEKKKILIENSNLIIEGFREKFIKYNVKYSKNLNMLSTYLKECDQEFWNKDLVSHFNQLAILLEKNHNMINSMQISIDKDISNPSCHFLLPLIPFINIIINHSSNIFTIMENQILGNYRISKTKLKIKIFLKKFKKLFNNNNNKNNKDGDEDEDDDEIDLNKINYKKSLNYSQERILKYFKRIEKVEMEMCKEYSKIEITNDLLHLEEDSQCEISRIHFFVNLLTSFTKQQKELSTIVYTMSRCLYRQNRIYHFEMFLLILCWFLNFPKFLYCKFKIFLKNRKQNKKLKKQRKKQKQEDEYEEDEEDKEEEVENNYLFNFKNRKNEIKLKIKNNFNYLISIIFCKWKFTIKFTILLSIFSIGYYEILTRSYFILFQNSSWFVVTFLYVASPSVGASGFYCCMRFFGTLLGVFSAYVVGVLFSLADSDGTKGLAYIALTFTLVFSIHFFVRGKPIQSFGNFFILSYATITFPEYTEDHALIITTLLRAFHISLAVFVIMLSSILILPYYDHRELEINLLDISIKQLEAFKSIFNHNSHWFDINNNRNIDDLTSISTVSSMIMIPKEIFQETMRPIFLEIRSLITNQRSLMFNSRFELLFNKQKYKDLKSLLNNISSEYMVLVGSEFIIDNCQEDGNDSYHNHHHHHHHNSKNYDQTNFLLDVKSLLLPKFNYLIKELDECRKSIEEIKSIKIQKKSQRYQNETTTVFRNDNSKQLIKQMYNDYHFLISKHPKAMKYSFCVHQLGCLIYTFDLFINLMSNITKYIWSITKTILIERKDSNYLYNNNLNSLDNLVTMSNSSINSSKNINNNNNSTCIDSSTFTSSSSDNNSEDLIIPINRSQFIRHTSIGGTEYNNMSTLNRVSNCLNIPMN